MTIAKTNGIDLSYDSFGDEADEAILLIAGLGTQMIRWTVPFCEALVARGYRVIRFDNRDSGHSTHFHQCPPPDFGALTAALMAGQRPEGPSDEALTELMEDAKRLTRLYLERPIMLRGDQDGS